MEVQDTPEDDSHQHIVQQGHPYTLSQPSEPRIDKNRLVSTSAEASGGRDKYGKSLARSESSGCSEPVNPAFRTSEHYHTSASTGLIERWIPNEADLQGHGLEFSLVFNSSEDRSIIRSALVSYQSGAWATKPQRPSCATLSEG